MSDRAGRLIDAVSIDSTESEEAELDVGGAQHLVLVAKLAATTTEADLTVAVRTFDSAGVEVPLTLAASATEVEGDDATDLYSLNRYDVRGLQRVKVIVTNSNVGAKVATVDFFTERNAA